MTVPQTTNLPKRRGDKPAISVAAVRLTDERGDKVEAVGTLTIAGGIAPLAILLRGKVYQPALTFADGTLNYRHVPAWIADGVLQLTGEPAA